METFEKFPDTDLIDNIVAGQLVLFEVLIRRYNPLLYKLGRTYGLPHHDVQDLMQETFIHAFQHISDLDNRKYFKTWLVRIMLNECYRKKQKLNAAREVTADFLSTEKRSPMFSSQDFDNTEISVRNKELGNIIEKAIQRLPTDYRVVFSLRALNGLTVQETSNALKITEANVKVRLNRAKAMLRKEIEKMYAPEDIFEFNLVYCDQVVLYVMSVIRSKLQ